MKIFSNTCASFPYQSLVPISVRWRDVKASGFSSLFKRLKDLTDKMSD